jgi:hypothetical protein
MRLGRLVALGVLAFVLLADSHVAAQYACPDQGRFWDPHKCTAFLEERVLTKFPGLFHREGRRLVVKFANGSQEVFVGIDDPDHESTYREYIFLDYFPNIRYGLIQVAGYEGGTTLLLNIRTGKSTDIRDTPVFSPDGTRCAVAWFSGMVGRGSLGVYRVSERDVTQEFLQEVELREIKNLRWLGNAALSFVDEDFSGKQKSKILRARPSEKDTVVWKIE